ncbi:MAG: 23S rRNA (pseudouridine(1915)-N(3))-methyltransferase RlmH [Malacoplasma sp.]|nr:23S rRNA (pseudouridine(1915)-N(3))-methyltransferase RlmH [Malacoplasma sp.]MDE5775131.1 23S rRNA (pseudouridine(1915)-N(3))-methyltransferase RlmH [Malacoplasma sp.]
MKIKIICFGKIKDVNLKTIIDNYLEKLNFFYKTEIIELSEEKIVNENNLGEIETCLKKESFKLIPFMRNEFNILLDINSKQLDSIGFAKLINEKINHSKNLNFFVGSSYGIDSAIKEKFDYKISFSNLTFNHQIFRLILLEQIYRAFTIIKNIKYHK